MPRYLYLMRHAQSADKQPGQADKDRELTSQGMMEALQMGAYLKTQNFFCDLFLSSTAVRAKFTSEYVLEALKWPMEKIQVNEEIYDASARTLFEFVGKLENEANSVMLVGHNPSITYLAEYLTKAEIGDMSTAGLAMIEFDISHWSDATQGSGKLIRYICPEMI